MNRPIEACRVCGNHTLALVADFGEQYLTGVFPAKVNLDMTKGPLRLVKCHGAENACGLVQLAHSYAPEEMYGENYGYHSGLNASMVRHLKSKVDRICRFMSLKPGDLIIDIGSNDGTTLGFYPEDLLLVGVDPTGRKFKQYYKPHVKLIADFFSAGLVRTAYPDRKAKVVTSISMLYDLETPKSFFHEVADILDDDGIWVTEQSYMPLMLERNAFDTVCHEHLEYYGIRQLDWLAKEAGLKIIDVELNEVNGGSCSVTFVHERSSRGDTAGYVQDILQKEEAAGLDELRPYHQFAERCQSVRSSILAFFTGAKNDGKSVYGLGASTKGNVLLQYCGIGPNDLPVIGDVNKDKFGCFAPGSWIPIKDEREVLAASPDYLLVLPWHFKEFFLSSPAFVGRNLVFPLPTLEIVKPA